MKNTTALSVCAIIALAGTSANAQSIDWLAPIDGNWATSANWLGGNVPNAIGEDAVLGLLGSYTVSVSNNFSYGNLTISNSMAKLSMGSGISHTLAGNFINDGTLAVNEAGSTFNSSLIFTSNASISGAGSIRLNSVIETGDAQVVSSGGGLLHSFGHLIHGSGTVNGPMLNDSDIVADEIGGLGLRVTGEITQTSNGRLLGDGGTLILGNGSHVTGGELSSLNGGRVLADNNSTIFTITNSGDLHILGQGDSLYIEETVINNGEITVNSDLAVFNAHLQFNTPSALLGGSGAVTLQSTGDINDAQVLTSGAFTGTIGTNQTVQGSGLINGTNGGTIANSGTILANDPLHHLGLAGNHVGGGSYGADDATLALRNGLIIDNALFNTIGSGIVELTNNGAATLSNITNNGLIGIRGQGGSVDLAGVMTNNGTILVNSDDAVFNAHIDFAANTEINGNGLIHMVTAGSLNDAQIITQSGITGTIGSNQTVDGSGIVEGRSGGTIVNLGTINGNHAMDGKDPAIALEMRGNHYGQGVGVYRSDDGILGLGNGLILVDAIFETSGVGIVDKTTSSLSTLSGIINNGEMGIRGQSGTLALTGPLENNGTLTVNSDGAIFNAHLRLDNALADINGSGTIRMVTAGNTGDAQIFTSGEFTSTIGSNQIVAGSGIIEGRNLGTIESLGIINGDDPSAALQLRGSIVGPGIFRSDDGLLELDSGLILDNATFDSSGTGIVEMSGGGTATLSNIVNLGEMGIAGQSGVIALAGPITNNGTITLNSDNAIFNAHLRFDSSISVDGVGAINMATAGNMGDAQLIANTGVVGTIGSGQTLSGDGLINNEFNINGTIDPAGLTREFDIDIVHFASSTQMIADLGGLLPGEFDRITLNGPDTIDLDGSLTVNLDSGYTPVFGDFWDIVDGGTIAGEFSSAMLPAAPLGQEYRVIYETNRVFVVLTCDADFTGDNVLNFFDVSKFLTFFNAQDPRADINGDGAFNFFDISAFLGIFGSACE